MKYSKFYICFYNTAYLTSGDKFNYAKIKENENLMLIA